MRKDRMFEGIIVSNIVCIVSYAIPLPASAQMQGSGIIFYHCPQAWCKFCGKDCERLLPVSCKTRHNIYACCCKCTYSGQLSFTARIATATILLIYCRPSSADNKKSLYRRGVKMML